MQRRAAATRARALHAVLMAVWRARRVRRGRRVGLPPWEPTQRADMSSSSNHLVTRFRLVLLGRVLMFCTTSRLASTLLQSNKLELTAHRCRCDTASVHQCTGRCHSTSDGQGREGAPHCSWKDLTGFTGLSWFVSVSCGLKGPSTKSRAECFPFPPPRGSMY